MAYIPVKNVQPGQEFIHYGMSYRRATKEEERRHPCTSIQRRRDVVLGYSGTMPVSFVPESMVTVRPRTHPKYKKVPE